MNTFFEDNLVTEIVIPQPRKKFNRWFVFKHKSLENWLNAAELDCCRGGCYRCLLLLLQLLVDLVTYFIFFAVIQTPFTITISN